MSEDKKTVDIDVNAVNASGDWSEAGGDGDFGITVRFTEEPSSKWEEENTQFIGNPVQGVYVSKKENVGANSSNVYAVETATHGMVSVFGSTVLDARFNEGNKGQAIPVGSEVLINFTGIVKGQKSEYKGFDVKFRPAPMVDAE